MLTVSVTVFSQNRFSKINSIPELKKEYASISEIEKMPYFHKYLKLSMINELRKEPDFSKFSDKILSQLVDEMFGTDDLIDENSIKEKYSNEYFYDVDWKTKFKEIDAVEKQGKEVSFEDLEYLYNPDGLTSGLSVMDWSAKGKNISYTTSNGVGAGTFYYFYKVKGDKLIHLRTDTNEISNPR